MKKTLVALAALATVGAAFAQSSVTLYGKIDWEVVSKSTRSAAGVTTNPGLQVNSAGLSGSRWGMKGTEDLGGGMSAIFDLQGGFAVDTGQTGQCGGQNVVSVNACSTTGVVGANGAAGVTGPRIFGRQAYAGLKGGWGQLTAGRQYAPYDNAFGALDAQGYTSNSAMGLVWNGTGNVGITGFHADAGPGGPGRVDNQVTYFTPAMGGFNAQLSWAPGENKAPGVNASRYTGIGLGYANGPLNVQYAYENMKTTSPAAVAGTSLPNLTVGSTNGSLIGASYNFGVVTPYAAYGRGSAPTGRDRSWALGATVPVGVATISGGYAKETSKANGAAVSSNTRGWGGQVVYPLSKRTNVYTEFASVRGTAAGAATSAKYRQLGVGMRHDF